MAWAASIPWVFWVFLALLAGSAGCRIAYGQRWRDMVRGTYFVWVLDLNDWLRARPAANDRGRPDL